MARKSRPGSTGSDAPSSVAAPDPEETFASFARRAHEVLATFLAWLPSGQLELFAFLVASLPPGRDPSTEFGMQLERVLRQERIFLNPQADSQPHPDPSRSTFWKEVAAGRTEHDEEVFIQDFLAKGFSASPKKRTEGAAPSYLNEHLEIALILQLGHIPWRRRTHILEQRLPGKGD